MLKLRLAKLIGPLALACGALFAAGSAHAETAFSILDHVAAYDETTGAITFSIAFSAAPDFTTVDDQGRLADAFQVYVKGEDGLPYPYYYDSIVRQEPAYLAQGLLLIRESGPSAGTQEAGGWGVARGTVPFQVSGSTVTFSAPASLLSDHGPYFGYSLLSVEYGGLTSWLNGTVRGTATSPVPEPQALALLTMGLGGLAIASRKRRRPQVAEAC